MVKEELKIGSISWVDLTVRDTETVRDFYLDVIGWKPSDVDMGGYQDYNMNLPEEGTPAAGVCHARGVNKDLPSQWLIYITVADLDKSIAKCVELGGKVIAGPKGLPMPASSQEFTKV